MPCHSDVSFNFQGISSHFVTLIATRYNSGVGDDFWEEHAFQLHSCSEDGSSFFFLKICYMHTSLYGVMTH